MHSEGENPYRSPSLVPEPPQVEQITGRKAPSVVRVGVAIMGLVAGAGVALGLFRVSSVPLTIFMIVPFIACGIGYSSYRVGRAIKDKEEPTTRGR